VASLGGAVVQAAPGDVIMTKWLNTNSQSLICNKPKLVVLTLIADWDFCECFHST